ncbi:hypothetical protein MKW94_015456 [Papaver nudicaule]|uniref:Uncharacterized protein n=1 Tax=Papaver nudicaule TaxID=74823 RepID=A0AA41V4L8_PAPNU|nr:hypothetical protein [Papaver nudicaule]
METIRIQFVVIALHLCVGYANVYKYRSITMLLILSLGFYTGLEGISIGVEDNEAHPWRSLPLYKIYVAPGMGFLLFKLFPDMPFCAPIAYLLASFAACPFGIAIGTRIDATTEGKIADCIFVINAGFAFGIFIYDTMQTVSKGFKPRKTDYLRVFASGLAGVGVLAVMFLV